MKAQDNRLLRLIAVFKVLKALALVALGFGALHFIHDNDAAGALAHLAGRLGLNPGGRYLDHALAKVANLPPDRFRDLGIGSFIYAALFMTEGLGLWFMKSWAEWFTTIITGSLIPLEMFEIYSHPSIGKVLILLLNIAIVAYLVLRLRKEKSGSGGK